VALQNQLTAFGPSAWAGVPPGLWTTTNSGKTWKKLSFNCRRGCCAKRGGGVLAVRHRDRPKVLTLIAASGATFADRSVNGGKTWAQTTFNGARSRSPDRGAWFRVSGEAEPGTIAAD
jgi:hypothetical protein